MTKNDLVFNVALRTGVDRRDVERVLSGIVKELTGTLAAGDHLMLRRFGTFEVRTRKARMGRNPRTNEVVPIPAVRIVKFRPSPILKDKVAGQ
jgi:DNA-binding protein HU-beta